MRDPGESLPIGRPGVDDASPTPRLAPRRSNLRLVRDARARRETLVALLLLLCYGFFRQSPAWNEYSRYDLVRALVEDGTTRIDGYHENTGDKAYYQGHYYSDKAPGAAIMGVPVFGLVSIASSLDGSATPDPETAIHALSLAVSGLPTAVLALLLLRFLRPAVGERWALIVSLGYAVGSMAFPFATMLFGHAASASFLFAAFYLLWRAKDPGRPGWLPALAGFLAGWSVLVEFTTVLGVVVLLAYALIDARPKEGRSTALRWRSPVLMTVGAAIPAVLLLAYNWVSFGGPFSLGYTNLAPGGFAEGIGHGVFGVSWPPDPEVFGDLLIGPRGLFRLAPWFALAPLGLFALRRRSVRPEVVVCGAIVVAFLFFNAGYFLPFGGWTPGPRFLMPALPFATVLVALAPRRVRPLVVILIGVSVALVLVATATMPNAPEAFADPYDQLWLPRLLAGDIADTLAWTRWGLHGVQPLVVLALGVALAAVALIASYRVGAKDRSGHAARRVSRGLTGVLVILVVAFAVPIPPVQALDLAIGGSTSSSVRSMAIVEVGAVPIRTDATMASLLWAQVENRGAAIDGTRIAFSVYAADGQPVWSAWHSDVSWRSGERQQLTVQWDTAQVQPGDYRFEVTVVTGDREVPWSARSGVVTIHRR